MSLTVGSSAPVPVPQPEPQPGRSLSPRVALTLNELQTLAEEATLTKSLAGCDVQFEVTVSIRAKSGQDWAGANEVLSKIKEGWKL